MDKTSEESWVVIAPVPSEAKTPNFYHSKFQKPQQVTAYTNKSGELMCYICRYINGRGEKVVRPYSYGNLNGKIGWHFKALPENRPLWNLQEIDQYKEKRILLVEGEKTAAVAAQAFPEFVVTTPMLGANAPKKMDFTPLKGRKVVIWPDNDKAGRKFAEAVAEICLTTGASEMRIVDVPKSFPLKWDLADTLPGGCEIRDIKKLMSLATKYKLQNEEANKKYDSRLNYNVNEGCITLNKMTQDGVVPWALCNFEALIECEEIHDDGAVAESFFLISGKHKSGRFLPQVTIPSSKFSSLSWVTESWGANAIVYAGSSSKDHLRVAIQLLSEEKLKRRQIFAHTGWREINGEWVYLHAGGGIGVNGQVDNINVSLSNNRLAAYELPNPPERDDLRKAIRSSLLFLELADKSRTSTILSAVYLAPLGEILSFDFSVFLSGPTGNQKSELTAMAQAHFGQKFERKFLPGSWSSTPNALELQSFRTKDAIFTVDDFKPGGSASEISKLHSNADRLLRAQGNRIGRDRMTADAKLQTQYYPRGLILSSGEDIPKGHSLRARMAILEIEPNEVNLDILTEVQESAEAGLLSQSMSGYIKWLSQRMSRLKETLPKRQKEIRSLVSRTSMHKRTPELVSMLLVSWEVFLDYALDAKAISNEEKSYLLQDGQKALESMARQQQDYQEGEEPARRFLDLVGAAFSSGRAHCVDAKTGLQPQNPSHWGWQGQGLQYCIGSDQSEAKEWIPRGDKIGWISGEELFLDPNTSFAVIQKFAREQDNTIPLNQATLIKRLAQGKYILTSSTEKKNTLKRMVEGRRPRVLVFPDKNIVLSSIKSGAVGAIGADFRKNNDLRPQTEPLFQSALKKEGPIVGEQHSENTQFVPAAPRAPEIKEEGEVLCVDTPIKFMGHL